MYAGNMLWSNILTGLVIFAVIGFTLLPIWPDAAKKVLWYFSVTFLIGTFAFCLFRFVAFLVLWLFGYEFWIFPRLFDESLSFQDSFKPVYSFDKGTAGQGYYRIALLLGLIGFGYWAYSQPTEFDGFLQAQKDFVDDLYTGKLLADVAFNPQDHLDRNKKVPSLEDLLKELENDERTITDSSSNNNMQEDESFGDNNGSDGQDDNNNNDHSSQHQDDNEDDEETILQTSIDAEDELEVELDGA
jgi:translocation protein SEC62